MNSLNHFLISVGLLLLLYNQQATINEILIFALIFGVLVDLDVFIKIVLNKKAEHHRTWLQEPLGIVLIGIPLGLLLSAVKPYYFFLAVVPYLAHVVLDYLTLHKVRPLAPFSKKQVEVGFFRPYPNAKWLQNNQKGFSENYFLLLNVIMLMLMIRVIY